MIGECEAGGGADWYDLDCLGGKLLFKINAARFSPLPTHTHHDEIRIIITEVLSLNITLIIFK